MPIGLLSYITAQDTIQNASVRRFTMKAMILTLLSSVLLIISPAISEQVIQLPRKISGAGKESSELGGGGYDCESWKFAIDTNDAGKWTVPERCKGFVTAYLEGRRYGSDSDAVADFAVKFAKTVKVASDGKDAWVFDIDETLLSNLPYYKKHGYGTEPYDEPSFDAWVLTGSAQALDASLTLYNELKKLGFTIFLLTGRDEVQRGITEKNLRAAGFTGWKNLFLRGESDKGKTATVYKSSKRFELQKEGYRLRGNSGDQWSDLLGFAEAERSFKLPNPIYYIP